jgi:hypothetical protein
MTMVDKARIAAVRKLQTLGYIFDGTDWQPPAPAGTAAKLVAWTEADALYAQLVQLADALDGCAEGSVQEAVRYALAEAIDGYQSIRWPGGRTADGKG